MRKLEIKFGNKVEGTKPQSCKDGLIERGRLDGRKRWDWNFKRIKRCWERV